MEEKMTDESGHSRCTIPIEKFPLPKLLELFNYFFPKEDGTKDLFSIEGLKTFAPRAPWIGFALLFSMFLWVGLVDAPLAKTDWVLMAYLGGILGSLRLLFSIIEYVGYLALSLFTKLMRRSPAVPLGMTAFGPLKALAIFFVLHVAGFFLSLLYMLFKLMEN